MADQWKVIAGTVDSHCHLAALADRGVDPIASLLRATEDGMTGVLDVGLSPADLDDRRSRFTGYDIVRFSSGIHPSEIEKVELEPALRLLQEQIDGKLIVAIGEIGLDFHWDVGSRADQIALFEAQVEVAVRNDLPVIVHNREADEETYRVLRSHRPRGVMHCFSGEWSFCSRCIGLGLFISFGGNLTFKRSEPIRDACSRVPPDRLLAETDSPYLSPMPVRGRPNHPGHLGFTLEMMAELRGEPVKTTTEETAANAAALFGVSSWSAGRS